MKSSPTGTRNRWATNNGAGDVVYPDRSAADAKLLTYTSAPLERHVDRDALCLEPALALRAQEYAAARNGGQFEGALRV